MFQELIELFERFVAAHEKQADAAMIMATRAPRTASYKGELPGQADGTECTAAPLVPKVLDWDPYTSPPALKYGKDKQEVLKRELKEKYGIEADAKLTGRGLHDLLLEQADKPQTAQAVVEQVYEAPVVPTAPVIPAAPVIPVAPVQVPTAPAEAISMDMIRDSLNALLMKGDEARACGLQLLSEATGGQQRLTDAATGQSLLPTEQFPILYAKVQDALGRF